MNLVFILKICLGISEVRGIVNVKCVREGYQTVQAALLDYTLTCYPTIQVSIRTITYTIGYHITALKL